SSHGLCRLYARPPRRADPALLEAVGEEVGGAAGGGGWEGDGLEAFGGVDGDGGGGEDVGGEAALEAEDVAGEGGVDVRGGGYDGVAELGLFGAAAQEPLGQAEVGGLGGAVGVGEGGGAVGVAFGGRAQEGQRGGTGRGRGQVEGLTGGEDVVRLAGGAGWPGVGQAVGSYGGAGGDALGGEGLGGVGEGAGVQVGGAEPGEPALRVVADAGVVGGGR